MQYLLRLRAVPSVSRQWRAAADVPRPVPLIPMPDCIVPGCGQNATNNLSVRLRPPDTSAIWSPNANAYVCDTHARSGARITVLFEPTDTRRVETRVYGAASEPVVRRTAIRH